MMSFALLVTAKSTLLLGAALLLSRLCRPMRASVRHWLFVLAFAGLVVIPVAGLVLPPYAIAVPQAVAVPAHRTTDLTQAVASGAVAAPAPSMPAGTVRRPVTIAQVATATWLAGVGIFLTPVAAGVWQIRRLRRSALPWADGQQILRLLAASSGVQRPIDALLHDDVAGPMTCGVFRPAIILPTSASEWDATSLRCALRHEVAHVARWDFLTQCLA
jgi:beta-lactamase regulating signal transducer with metallopeptidase domain